MSSASSQGAPRRRRLALRLRLISFGFVGLMVAGVAVLVADLSRVEKEAGPLPEISAAATAAARPGMEARWIAVQARLVARLKQANPPELGAVWATRTGRICGLVNGFGSFGGLSGMVRFYTVEGAPVFGEDGRPDFKEVWAQCDRDRWIVLHAGSDQTGFCPTKLGQARCETVKVWLPK
ncbi:MAG: hypothetical protein JWP92_1998 [Caulobacter sp.]|nr:hypothetical protein [Caulobacter sp.]